MSMLNAVYICQNDACNKGEDGAKPIDSEDALYADGSSSTASSCSQREVDWLTFTRTVGGRSGDLPRFVRGEQPTAGRRELIRRRPHWPASRRTIHAKSGHGASPVNVFSTFDASWMVLSSRGIRSRPQCC